MSTCEAPTAIGGLGGEPGEVLGAQMLFLGEGLAPPAERGIEVDERSVEVEEGQMLHPADHRKLWLNHDSRLWLWVAGLGKRLQDRPPYVPRTLSYGCIRVPLAAYRGSGSKRPAAEKPQVRD
ncbi:hypothetical protein GCM10009850_068710 [Nonomuraea monospora]|uniref:Uncharacterized protein n=1 Tax=Nonomuraea monospora TaxID=568818 RepID=A0ABN3CQ41_9ACTN